MAIVTLCAIGQTKNEIRRGMTKETVRMNGLKITDAALEELQKALEEQGEVEDPHVRIAIQGGGCSGFQYHLAIETADHLESELDTVEDHKGVKVAIDKKSLLYLDGTVLDWIDELSRRGFKFENPNAMSTCGCGHSFSA